VVDAIPCAYLVPNWCQVVMAPYIPIVVLRISIFFERPCALQITCGGAIPYQEEEFTYCAHLCIYIYIYIRRPLVGHQAARHIFLNKHACKPYQFCLLQHLFFQFLLNLESGILYSCFPTSSQQPGLGAVSTPEVPTTTLRSSS